MSSFGKENIKLHNVIDYVWQLVVIYTVNLTARMSRDIVLDVNEVSSIRQGSITSTTGLIGQRPDSIQSHGGKKKRKNNEVVPVVTREEPRMSINDSVLDFDYVDEKDETEESLHQAARNGDFEDLKEFFKSGNHDIHEKDENGLTPLHYACQRNFVEIVRFLLRSGADVNVIGKSGVTPLHFAAKFYKRSRKIPKDESERKSEPKKKKLQRKRRPSTNEKAFKNRPKGIVLSTLSDHSDEEIELEVIRCLRHYGAHVNCQDDLGMTPLHYAAIGGNDIAVRELLIRDKIKDKLKMTALHLAVNNGHMTVVETLLKAGADPLPADNKGETMLHYATNGGHLELFKTIFNAMKKAGNHLSSEMVLTLRCKEGNTVLHISTDFYFHDITRFILDQGCTPNVARKNLVFPIHLAAENDDIESLEMLCNAGATIDITNRTRETAMHRAAIYDSENALEYLISKSAYKGKGKIKALKCMLSSEESCQVFDDLGSEWELSDELFHGLDKCVYLLYSQPTCTNVNMDRYNLFKMRYSSESSLLPNSDSLRHHSTRACYQDAIHQRSLNQIMSAPNSINYGWQLEKGELSYVWMKQPPAPPNVMKTVTVDVSKLGIRINSAHIKEEIYPALSILDVPDRSLNTPLHVAAVNGYIDCLTVLVAEGAKLDVKNENRKTPLHLAAENGRTKIVNAIVKENAWIIDAEDDDKNSPTHLAAINGHDRVIQYLIDGGAELQALNNQLWTPLDCAAAAGHEIAVQQLLDQDVPVDPHDADETTPLHLASARGHTGVMDILLQYGADIEDKDNQGRNALDYAIENQQKDSALLIINRNDWEKAMRNPRQKPNGTLDSPMRMLIRRMPDVAEAVFDRCISITEENSKPITIYNFEFLDDSYTLHLMDQHGAGIDVSYDENFRLKKTAKTYSKNKNYMKTNHPLKIMAESKRQALLEHPLCKNLMDCKWRKFASFFIYFNVIGFMLFLFFLTAYILVANDPASSNPVIEANSPWNTFLDICYIGVLLLSAHNLIREISFLNPIYGLIKTSVMMIGEFEFESMFNDPPVPLPYPELTYAAFVLFIIVMSIILMNVQVGLAVDDIKGVQEQSELQRLAMQVDTILHAEYILPKFIRHRVLVLQNKVKADTDEQLSFLKELRLKTKFNLGTISTVYNPEKLEEEHNKKKQEELYKAVMMLRDNVRDIKTQHQRIQSQLMSIIKNAEIEWEDEDEFLLVIVFLWAINYSY
ncbi:Transient receptor potential cation channel subfamily A member 1 [Nymphon striatum]|nr:Transient receptor potential cation channel subfamily A member 1 [Nymphon striatum]